MRQIFLSIFFLMMIGLNSVYAQKQGWLSPVTFSEEKFLCDTSLWQLVFSDDFNGDKIDTSKWFTFNSNNRGTNDDWCEARVGYPGNETIIRDSNAVVSDGTLKLQIKQQTNTWQCNSCDTNKCTAGFGRQPVTKNYTSGYISSKTTYNNGKFEARIRMPDFEGAWAASWLWATAGVNEIDLAEAYGGDKKGKHSVVTYNLHAWPDPFINRKVTEHFSIGHHFPNQGSKDRNKGKFLDPGKWHIYTCVWDTARIIFYLDHVPVDTIWKYYQQQKSPFVKGIFKGFKFKQSVASGCKPGLGSWEITQGFPYNNKPQCKLIFSVAMTNSNKVLPSDGFLGQMEIDYVRVWQRHPEQDGHPVFIEESKPRPLNSKPLSPFN